DNTGKAFSANTESLHSIPQSWAISAPEANIPGTRKTTGAEICILPAVAQRRQEMAEREV
ncbi:MAG: hypothetical protein P8R45_14650, partial [Candidatus Binatia bacterium]|nr:hypothetical protein [Candidatus Binatia bacterium]